MERVNMIIYSLITRNVKSGINDHMPFSFSFFKHDCM